MANVQVQVIDPIDRNSMNLTSFRAVCSIASIGTSCSDGFVRATLLVIKLSRGAHEASSVGGSAAGR